MEKRRDALGDVAEGDDTTSPIAGTDRGSTGTVALVRLEAVTYLDPFCVGDSRKTTKVRHANHSIASTTDRHHHKTAYEFDAGCPPNQTRAAVASLLAMSSTMTLSGFSVIIRSARRRSPQESGFPSEKKHLVLRGGMYGHVADACRHTPSLSYTLGDANRIIIPCNCWSVTVSSNRAASSAVPHKQAEKKKKKNGLRDITIVFRNACAQFTPLSGAESLTRLITRHACDAARIAGFIWSDMPAPSSCDMTMMMMMMAQPEASGPSCVEPPLPKNDPLFEAPWILEDDDIGGWGEATGGELLRSAATRNVELQDITLSPLGDDADAVDMGFNVDLVLAGVGEVRADPLVPTIFLGDDLAADLEWNPFWGAATADSDNTPPPPPPSRKRRLDARDGDTGDAYSTVPLPSAITKVCTPKERFLGFAQSSLYMTSAGSSAVYEQRDQADVRITIGLLEKYDHACAAAGGKKRRGRRGAKKHKVDHSPEYFRCMLRVFLLGRPHGLAWGQLLHVLKTVVRGPFDMKKICGSRRFDNARSSKATVAAASEQVVFEASTFEHTIRSLMRDFRRHMCLLNKKIKYSKHGDGGSAETCPEEKVISTAVLLAWREHSSGRGMTYEYAIATAIMRTADTLRIPCKKPLVIFTLQYMGAIRSIATQIIANLCELLG